MYMRNYAFDAFIHSFRKHLSNTTMMFYMPLNFAHSDSALRYSHKKFLISMAMDALYSNRWLCWLCSMQFHVNVIDCQFAKTMEILEFSNGKWKMENENLKLKMVLTVVQPIGDGRYRYAAFEDGLLSSKHHCRDETTVSPAPNANTCLVQIVHIGQQVASFS